MKYSKKITEYAFLPDKAFPLDARSHFVDVNTAIKAITGDLIATAEEAALVENSYKRYYAGQIITTTNSGTYQVTNDVNSFYSDIEDYEVCFQFNSDRSQIETLIDRDGLFPIVQQAIQDNKLLNYYKIYLKTGAHILVNGNKIAAQRGFIISNNDIKWDTQCYLKPFSGGGGGSSTLSITANEPLNFDKATSTLSLSLGGGLTKESNGALTLSIDGSSGLKIDNNKRLTLSIDSNSNLFINNNGLSVKGTHYMVNNDSAISNIPNDNYIYEEL